MNLSLRLFALLLLPTLNLLAQTAPVITVPPPGIFAVAVGQPTTLGVTATGGALTYQWRKAGTPIGGATAATYAIASTQLADAGNYDVVVSNPQGTATSAGTRLVVGQASGEGYVYNESAGQLTLVGYQGPGGDITIPAVIAGKPVIALGRDVFVGSSTLTGALIPEGVKTLGQGVFFKCTNLTRVVVPSTVTTISSYCFQQCPKLTSIVIAEGNPAFSSEGGILYNKTKTTLLQCSRAATGALELPATVTAVTGSAFFGVSLESISFPAGMTSFAPGWSYALTGLTAVYCRGDAPVLTTPGPFDSFANLTVHRQAAAQGWGATFGTRPTAIYDFPVITTQPAGQVLAAPGGAATFSVVATGSPALTYQWSRNGVPLPGATTATLTLANVQPAAVGTYAVRVANAAGAVRSAGAALEIRQAGSAAVHAAPLGGYLPGQAVTVTSTLSFSGTPAALSWSVLLPPGWSFASASAAGAAVAPVAGQAEVIDWAWSEIPPSPVSFSYTLNVPTGQTGAAELVALAGVRSGLTQQFLAQPDPLVLNPIPSHLADTDRNFRIGLLELTRVIEVYNTRNWNVRTGAYGPAIALTEDGFETVPTRASGATAVLARYHSADSNRDGRIALLELTRVIELYNFRSGAVRTGQYRLQEGTEDGFAPGPLEIVAPGSGEIVVNLQVVIDHESELVVTPDGIYWIHYVGARPGYYGNDYEIPGPVLVDGTPWTPAWDTTGSRAAGTSAVLPFAPGRFTGWSLSTSYGGAFGSYPQDYGASTLARYVSVNRGTVTAGTANGFPTLRFQDFAGGQNVYSVNLRFETGP
jgi:hypothetical protein